VAKKNNYLKDLQQHRERAIRDRIEEVQAPPPEPETVEEAPKAKDPEVRVEHLRDEVRDLRSALEKEQGRRKAAEGRASRLDAERNQTFGYIVNEVPPGWHRTGAEPRLRAVST
jgi:hypothetical protein